jgi:hypothetical protein
MRSIVQFPKYQASDGDGVYAELYTKNSQVDSFALKLP